jgi:ATP-dependent RNA helicase RhlE
VHRIGRTARAGSTGMAISLVSPDEAPYLKDIVKLLGRDVPSQPLPQFEMRDSGPTENRQGGDESREPSQRQGSHRGDQGRSAGAGGQRQGGRPPHRQGQRPAGRPHSGQPRSPQARRG